MHQPTIHTPSGILHLPYHPIDAVGLKERALSFKKRSIKSSSKLSALYLAIQMMDLTSLEGSDTEDKIKNLCKKAICPVPLNYQDILHRTQGDLPPIPSVAAVCVYPQFVSQVREYLQGTTVKTASVATWFPSGQAPTEIKIKDIKFAVDAGAEEIDMVIDRGSFLSGQYQKVYDEIRAAKDVCQESVHLKVILETGELFTHDNIRCASWLAMEAGADFIKTSTGKISPAATMDVTLLMLNAIQDFYLTTNKVIGMKPAGGIRTAKDAIHYLVMVKETLGTKWLNETLFRFGASSLLNDVLRQIFYQITGNYYSNELFSHDS